jgi:transposase
MYRDIAQWTLVRRKELEEGVSRRQLVKETGLSRNTIRKMLLHKFPQPFRRMTRKPSLEAHTATLDAFALLNDSTPARYRVSISEIHRYLQREENYSGSYSAVRHYLKFRLSTRQKQDRNIWVDLYDAIISLSKQEAISLLRSLAYNGAPLISATRVHRLQRDIASLHESKALSSHHARVAEDVDWIHRVLRQEIPPGALQDEYQDCADFRDLIDRLCVGTKSARNRAMAILAHLRGISDHVIATALGMSRVTVRSCRRQYETGGVAGLFARKARLGTKVTDEGLAASIFALLHEPPGNHGINRATWTMADICAVLTKQGNPACAAVVRAITKAAGYKWRKARVALTSNDPNYAEKLAHIRSILSGLQSDEAFFSIDEFGPFAVKTKPGRALVGPGEERQVAQWQKSKGCLILTAALELSGNQVTHFYSTKKNTTEMIRMMDLLLERYRDRRKIYLSWDAASWHISKRLFERIEENNKAAADSNRTLVETAPLPARAQFLNVIESIFSGMARAIIHNSDYGSVDEAKAAIDRYFEERNRHFFEHPHRAGNKIWGKERVPPKFSEGHNCKDPRYQWLFRPHTSANGA